MVPAARQLGVLFWGPELDSQTEAQELPQQAGEDREHPCASGRRGKMEREVALGFGKVLVGDRDTVQGLLHGDSKVQDGQR